MSDHVPLFELKGPIHEGRFISRPNRFTVLLEQEGRTLRCHLHDPGRLKELLIPGAQILFRAAPSPFRKTKYDVLAVNASGRWVITDSRMPNLILKRMVELSILEYVIVGEEVPCGDSRIDFLLERNSYLTEVKGCTLCRNGLALFPDAPTSRGRKQVEIMLEQKGTCPLLVFVVMRPDAYALSPNIETDPKFYESVKVGMGRGLSTLSFKVSLEFYRTVYFMGEIPVVIDFF